jgi:DNA-binding NtrC family response regulator
VVGSSRVLGLRQPKINIGTARENDLVLADPYISRRHCSLSAGAGGLWIRDAGSRNGTWVNDVRIERCRVWAGSRVVLGRTGLQLLGPEQKTAFCGIVGDHPSIRKVLAQIDRLAPTLRPVLILGETGTGKELVARAIHAASPCRLAPFEPLNCGAIPRDLAEAELFGHAPGAFTGATRERRGAFERADGGTLFLDEIGEMPPDLQPKILRALEEGMVQRVGEEQRRQVAVRVVAATHRDLLREADLGRFRLDLYHRLAVGIIGLPPLRERREDIPLLVDHFLDGCAGSSRGLGRPTVRPEAMALLKSQPWGGNVRELRNALHRAVAEGEGELRVEDFTFLSDNWHQGRPPDGAVPYLGRSFEEIKRDVFLRVIESCEGNRTAAASALGMPKSTFFDQLRGLKLR